jgi:hypothetical protein
MNTLAHTRETIVELFQLNKLSPERANDMLARIGKIVMQNVLMRVLPELSEEDLAEYEKLVDTQVTPEVLVTFFNQKVHNFNGIVTEEAESFFAESAELLKKTEKVDTQNKNTNKKAKGCLLLLLLIFIPIIFCIVIQ